MLATRARWPLDSGAQQMSQSIAKSQSIFKPPAAVGSWRKPLVCGALAIAVCLAYVRIVRCDFVNLDDTTYIIDNTSIQEGLNWKSLCWAFTTGYAANWHPLTWITHIIDCSLYGANPMGSHLENVLLHISNSMLLFLLLEYATGAFWRSATVAALFALHPFHVESVAWISERKDVLSTLFWLLSAWLYCAYARSSAAGNAGRSARFYAGSLLGFAAGLMSKPMVVTLPCVLLLLDYWPLQRRLTWTRLAAEKIPFFLLSAAASVTTLLAQKAGGAVRSTVQFTVISRLENAPIAYARYVQKTFWPSNFRIFYPYIDLWPFWIVAAACLALILISVLAFRRRRSQPYGIVGWLWFLGMLLPTIGLIQVGEASMADRYSYLPVLGLFIAAVWGMAELAESRTWLRESLPFAAVAALAGCSALTFQQVGVWRDTATLFGHAIKDEKNCASFYNLGCVVSGLNDLTNAALNFNRCLQLNPNYSKAYDKLALVQLQWGQCDLAISNLHRALALQRQFPEAWEHLGQAQAATGQLDPAVESYKAALASGSTNAAGVRHRLGLLHIRQRRFDPAIAQLTAATESQPSNAQWHSELANAWIGAGKITNAVNEFKKALNLDPNLADACNNLAWIMAASPDPALRDGPAAVRLARRAVELTGASNPYILGAFAAACAEAGDFDHAIGAAQQARELALARSNSALAGSLAAQIQLYQAHKPFRDANAR